MLSSLFSEFVSLKFGVSVPNDYLEYSASAMANQRLYAYSNALNNLAKGWGTPRTDGSDSRFPVKRMPMGLIEYAASFYSHDNLQSASLCFIAQCIRLETFAGYMSVRLSFVATNNVLQFWSKMG